MSFVARLGLLTVMLNASTVRLDAQSAPQTAARQAVVTTADFKWLTGKWEGRLAGYPNAVAEMTFSPPAAHVMIGMMRLTANDTVLVLELVAIVDSPNGPELRFRHFSPELVASETNFRQTMRLKSHEADREVFENVVPFDKDVNSTQPRTAMYLRKGADGFVAHADIIGSDGKPDVIEVVYKRAP